MKVLIAEDDAHIREGLVDILEAEGYHVVMAPDGRAALDAWRRASPDFVLLDIMMPGLSGVDVLKRLRQSHSAQDLPIIMATAKDGSDDMVEALDAGANDYVTKPLDFPVVLARVQAQLRSKVPARERGTGGSRGIVATGNLKPGTVLGGRYRLDRTIGSGSFGTVFQGVHVDLRRPVAVKVLQRSFEPGSASFLRFRQEGISACRIRHPNAVEVLDFGVTEEGVAYLVMELLEGRSLAEEIEAEGLLSPLRCAQILSPICSVLGEAHRLKIIHRDIKPANIFLHANHHGEVVKVLDFGIALLLDDPSLQRLTMDDGIIGTPAYMAPERVTGGDDDGKSDVYSLGVMLYQMLTGELPFGEDKGLSVIAIAMRHLQEAPIPLRQLRPALPWTLEALLLQTLEKRGAARPTADELNREFAMAIGLPAPTSVPAPGPRPQAVSETRASDLRPTLRFPTGDAGS
ncbi:MAG: response regulator [Acidobacteria bacterium]|nr:response regulator [Acidobacteriota bacterium]